MGLTFGLLGGCLCLRLGLGLALVQCSSLSPAVGRSMRASVGGVPGRAPAVGSASFVAAGRALPLAGSSSSEGPGEGREAHRWPGDAGMLRQSLRCASAPGVATFAAQPGTDPAATPPRRSALLPRDAGGGMLGDPRSSAPRCPPERAARQNALSFPLPPPLAATSRWDFWVARQGVIWDCPPLPSLRALFQPRGQLPVLSG